MGPQFQNFTLKRCFLTWRRVSETFRLFPYIKWAKKKKKEKNIRACARGNSSLIFEKLNMKRSKKCLFSFDQVKNSFAYFGGIKILKKVQF